MSRSSVFLFAVRNLLSEGTEKTPTFFGKCPTFFGKSPTFFEKSPTFYEKALTFFEKAPREMANK